MNAKHRTPKLIPQLEPMDTRVVPSVIGLGLRFQARAAVARQAFGNAGATNGSRFLLPGTARLNPLKLQASNHALFGGRAAFPTLFGGSPFSRQAAQPNLARPVIQSTPRVLLTSIVPPVSAPAQTLAANEIGDVKNGPMAKAGPDLIAIYQAFGPSGSGSLPAGGATSIVRVGSNVGVDIRTSGDVNALAAMMTSLGMQVQATDPNTHIVEGLLPIAQLPNVAQLSQVTSIQPIYTPQHG
jgi:hypothetical protein